MDMPRQKPCFVSAHLRLAPRVEGLVLQAGKHQPQWIIWSSQYRDVDYMVAQVESLPLDGIVEVEQGPSLDDWESAHDTHRNGSISRLSKLAVGKLSGSRLQSDEKRSPAWFVVDMQDRDDVRSDGPETINRFWWDRGRCFEGRGLVSEYRLLRESQMTGENANPITVWTDARWRIPAPLRILVWRTASDPWNDYQQACRDG